MAHIAKYKATSVGHMLAHYRRDASSLGRENIDPTRTKDNYTLGLDDRDGKVRAMDGIEPNWATVEGRIERVNKAAKAAGKRAVRKDAVVMADVVVTLPENVRKGDEGKFFGYAYWFLILKLGKENMMGGFVHRDEVRKDGSPVRDHMHVPFTPIVDGRFNYKKMCPRTFYQSLHKELGDYLEKQMGYRPEVELGDETRAMRVYADKSADIDKVRGAVERGIVEPAEQQAAQAVEDAAQRVEEARAELDGLEQLRVESHVKLGAVNAKVDEKRAQAAEIDRQIAEKIAEIERLDGEIGEKIELRDEVGENLKREQRRLESVRRTAGRFEEDVEELEAIASLAERFDHAGRFEKRGMLDEIAARCDGLRGRVEQVVEGIRGAVGRLEVAIADLARKLAPRSALMTTRALKRDLAALERDYVEDDDRSPKARAAEAQRAARARDANRDDRPPQRSWSQSR